MSTFDDMRELRDEAGGLPSWRTPATKLGRERLTADVERLRASLEEREADMHARIRAGYDRTVADSWRAKVAQVEAERDEAHAYAGRIAAAADAWDKAASAYYASEGTPSEWDAMQAAKRAFREAQRGARPLEGLALLTYHQPGCPCTSCVPADTDGGAR